VTDLLIEIGCEELPAASIEPMARHLSDELQRVLIDSELTGEGAQWFGTPRRLAVRIQNVGAKQSDRMVERRGPSMAAAYKDGEPSKALTGFLRSAGATVDDHAHAKAHEVGRSATRVFAPGCLVARFAW